MQTFLPDKSFVHSMEVLDQARLRVQRIEAAQVLEILLGKSIIPDRMRSIVPFDWAHPGWSRHPVVMMWRDHEEWLKLYLACAIGEFEFRGFTSSFDAPAYYVEAQSPPPWLGDENLHRSHRSNLIRKNPSHYRHHWPDEIDDLPYYWPTKNGY